MHRRKFLGSSLAAGMFLTDGTAQSERELEVGGTGSTAYALDVTVERKRPGKPHKGKVLAAIQPHCDDIPIFAGGTVLKLLDEGYTGVLITMSNDSMAGEGASVGDIVLKNERDTVEMARRLGVTETFFLNYPNHNMDGWPILESSLREKSRSLRHGQSGRIGLLDGRLGMGLSGAFQGRPETSWTAGKVLLRPRPPTGQPSGRYYGIY